MSLYEQYQSERTSTPVSSKSSGGSSLYSQYLAEKSVNQTPPASTTTTPSFWDKTKNFIASSISKVPILAPGTNLETLTKTAQGIVKGFKETPITPKSGTVSDLITHPLQANISAIKNTAKAFGDAFSSGFDNVSKDFSKITDNHSSLLQKGVSVGEAGLHTVNSIFGMALSPLQGLASVPGVGYAVDGVNKLFGAISEGASSGSESQLDQMPLSQETKDTLRPLVRETSALVAQIVAGEVGGMAVKGVKGKISDFKALTDNAKTIADVISKDKALEAIKPKTEPSLYEKYQTETAKIPLLTKPTEPLLLTEGVKPTEIQGQGFTMKEKASKYELERGKAINAYQEALTKYNEKPTVTGRLKVQRLKEVRDTYLQKTAPTPTSEVLPTLAGEKVPTLTTPEVTLAQTKLAEVKPTIAPEITTPPQPIKGTGDAFTSRVFERMKAENPEVLTGDLQVNRVKLQEDAQRATDLIEKNKQEAFDIAMGKKTSADVLSTSVNIALTEKALADGNNALAARLIKNRSLEQTRRGQELVAERGSIADNSTSRYVKELLASRLEALGKDYLTDIKETVTRKSDKTKATRVIDDKVRELESKIKSKKLDARTALDLLDKLTCV